ncbi:hypothetical protein [Desulfobacula sp.]|uniref:hypothetical protein n=1 Tax=Desulfobacula sp. TaxID=2593537 RepID=UPI0026282E89|nr:hypothetical protein [Desulfobacula sp.]
MIKNKYRLKGYIITGYDRFFYTWEMNIVLGEHRIGNCFIIGDILVIDSWSHKKDGCLKLEYHEKLMKLPAWNKTRYYCFSTSLRNVSTGQNLSNYFNQWRVNQEKINIRSVNVDGKGIFRLDRHKIIIEENGNISWQVYEGLNKIKEGRCIIESGILFIGSKEYDSYEKQSKKEWLRRLKLLPQWDKTFAWSHRKVLRTCQQENEIKKSNLFRSNIEHIKTIITGNMAPSKNHEYKYKKLKKTNLNLLPPGVDCRKLSLNYFARMKAWRDRFVPLLIEVICVGFRFFSLFLKKIVHGFRKTIEYFSNRFRR